MSDILITGSETGLGLEIAIALERSYGQHCIYGYDIKNGYDVRRPNVDHIDYLDVLINNAVVNKIDWLENFEEEDWDSVMDTNAKGIFLMTQALLPQLKASKGTVLNIVSNAAHVPMRCSLAYNASKSAAHIMTLQMARELTKKYGITVFGVAPNKLSGTAMSDEIDKRVQETRGWSAEYAEQYQLDSLVTGEKTPASSVAEFIEFLLSSKERHKYLSGCILPYGA